MSEWIKSNRRKTMLIRNTWLTLGYYFVPVLVVGWIVEFLELTETQFEQFLAVFAYLTLAAASMVFFIKTRAVITQLISHVCSFLLMANWFLCFAWWVPALGEARAVALFFSPLMILYLYPYKSVMLVVASNSLVTLVYCGATYYATEYLGQPGSLIDDLHFIVAFVVVSIVVGRVGVLLASQKTKLVAYSRGQKEAQKQLENALQKLEVLASTDELTGLMNRRKINEVVEYEFNKAQRSNSVMSIGLLDLDHFKEINDRYGHICGDKVLVAVADLLKTQTREIDSVARWGGEEFFMLLPDVALEDAEGIFTRLIENINKLEILYNDSVISLSASVGVREISANSDLNEAIKGADDNLYKAKHTGRNKVVSNID